MSWWQALILGVLQGLTEFLPVSSSGHLALAQMASNGLGVPFSQPGVVFDAMLHVGTAAAVVWHERELISPAMVKSIDGRRLVLMLIIGTLATGVTAFPIRDLARTAFERPLWVGCFLVLTGFIVLSTRVLKERGHSMADTRWWQALVMGLVQGLAVLPGISRSGATIAAGLGCGLQRSWVARFSFLLGVPAILGATVLEVVSEREALAGHGAGFWLACALGTLAAGLYGYLALRVVIRTVSSEVFHRFAWYCLPLGVVVVALALWGPW